MDEAFNDVQHEAFNDVQHKGGCRTISVPEAGQIFFGLSRNGSYDAAARGEIPTIRVGRKLRVPMAAMEKKIGRVIDAA